ncbi:hypothetical protein ACLQ2N_08175 [Streptomyces sp. DT224]|uniref:hypothetical protein n=1 Tax=Streptomyces sp. DT224 TaxID=3393426 RepID=UPI003CF481A0
MPMIVNPSAPQITPPARVVSPDGWLAATVDSLWAGVVLSYDAATPADTARNFALNPSVEVDLADTQAYGSSTRARVTTDARYGAACVQHTSLGTGTAGTTWSIPPQGAGTTITISVWVKIPASGVTNLLVNWRSGSVALFTRNFPQLVAPGEWAQLTATYTIAAGQTCDRVGVAAATSAAGVVWWADGCMAEVGSEAHPYVDGGQPGCVWDGAPNASTSRRVTSTANPSAIRKVRIVRQDPGGSIVPVRSADTAWAVEGRGTAYDHEAPLGRPVVYTATPIYADGTTGPASSLAVTVPAPQPGEDRDLWIKSVDEPGLSMRAMIVDWPGPSSAGRLDALDAAGSPYRVVSWDVHGAETYAVTVDVPPEQVEHMRELLRAGVLLAQVRPEYLTPDSYFVPGDIVGPTPTGKLGSSEGYRYTFTVEPVERPHTEGQRMRMPGWSYDTVAARFATYDTVAASYPTYAALSTDGVT